MRVSRRRFLFGQTASADDYREWVAHYRSGRFVETAGRMRDYPARELRRAQSGFVGSLPRSDEPAGFLPRLAAALLHAEAVAHFGLGPHVHSGLIADPLASLPSRWPPNASRRQTAQVAWGSRGVSNFRVLLGREVRLGAARLRLAVFDLAAASRILGSAESARDPALLWQLGVIRAVRARYLGEMDLWPEVESALRDAVAERLLSPAEGRASPRAVARALADPDDLNLRLALVALGRGRGADAAEALSRVSGEPAPRLRVPKLLLDGELRLAQGRLPGAVSRLREAAVLAPASQEAIAALATALEASGQWDEAGTLAGEVLRAPRTTRPWAEFLFAWADPEEPALDWLRDLVRI